MESDKTWFDQEITKLKATTKSARSKAISQHKTALKSLDDKFNLQQTKLKEELVARGKVEEKPKEEEKEAGPKKDWKKRDLLKGMEEKAQKIWSETRVNEANPVENKKKFFVTFPYPYMNGRLHLGHAYSMTKSEFTARFKKITGYNTLFPFSFHCTGMPIMASADKLRRSYEKFAEDKDETFKTERKSIYSILRKCNVDETEITKFQDPKYWCTYFPKYAKQDLKSFGICADWRRSFITTDINPYYNSFIRWQFKKLQAMNCIDFGKRPAVYSTLEDQPCADHDRSSGEGFGPQEQTLIKMKVLEFKGALEALKGKNVYLVAATLRPETMYGQTNCFVLPTGTYGAYIMKNDEIFITSEYSIRNMAYQGLTKVDRKFEKILEIKGKALIGVPLKAPLTKYERIYAIPMMTISMEKGTGIVTSVPSDAPDDWACLRDFQTDKKLQKKWGIKLEWVIPYAPIPIIEIPGYSVLSAVKACDEYKVKVHTDVKKLKLAKKEVYLDGFYKGVFIIGEYAGKKVETAKDKIRQKLIDNNEAAIYWEPEEKVVSRSGDICVVTFCDQWFFKYGDEEWKKQILDYVKSDEFETFFPFVKKAFIEALEWISSWGCSRNYGLGTKLP